MKKISLLLFLFVMFGNTNAQIDTIAGWSFPTDSVELAIIANSGISGNIGNSFLIASVESTGTPIAITTSNGSGGSGDYSATAGGWDNGANDKCWSVEFKADGYSNFSVSSKMRSGGNKPGPKFWKLQYKLEGGAWADIPNGEFTIESNWTAGVVENLPIPSNINNPGTASVFIRWIMTSNENIDGVNVDSTGICKIDDIVITAQNNIGIEEQEISNRITLYPNPSNGVFTVASGSQIESIQILNWQGQVICVQYPLSNQVSIDLSKLKSGLYFVHVFSKESYLPGIRKVFIR